MLLSGHSGIWITHTIGHTQQQDHAYWSCPSFSPGLSTKTRHGAEAALGLQCGWTDEHHLSLILGHSEVQVQTLCRCLLGLQAVSAATASPPKAIGRYRRANICCCLPQLGCLKKYVSLYYCFPSHINNYNIGSPWQDSDCLTWVNWFMKTGL